jgi:FkbM family methyltransferase
MNGMKTFVEIGCADFDTLLPLAARGWRGFFIEPVERMRESLIRQAQRAGVNMLDVEFAPICISDHDGSIEMVESLGDDWASGISHVVGGLSSGLLDNPRNTRFRGRTLSVPCETLDTFVSKRGIDRVDFMKIDVEGHELAVLEPYSWRVKPSLIKLEHKHCDLDRLKRILGREGYHTYIEREDLYAII